MKLRLLGNRDVMGASRVYDGPGVFDVPDNEAERFLERSFWEEVDDESTDEAETETETESEDDGSDETGADEGEGEAAEEESDGDDASTDDDAVESEREAVAGTEPDEGEEEDEIARILAEIRSEDDEEEDTMEWAREKDPDDVRDSVIETMSVDYSEDNSTEPPVPLDKYLTANATPLRDSINAGDFDDDLDTMIAIETSTQDRKTVKDALRQRKQYLGHYDSE